MRNFERFGGGLREVKLLDDAGGMAGKIAIAS